MAGGYVFSSDSFLFISGWWGEMSLEGGWAFLLRYFRGLSQAVFLQAGQEPGREVFEPIHSWPQRRHLWGTAGRFHLGDRQKGQRVGGVSPSGAAHDFPQSRQTKVAGGRFHLSVKQSGHRAGGGSVDGRLQHPPQTEQRKVAVGTGTDGAGGLAILSARWRLSLSAKALRVWLWWVVFSMGMILPHWGIIDNPVN